jgi:uncharacterized protein (TIGR02444 family)
VAALPTSSLWEFSLALYARPGVAPACLDLQARFGADVNLLFAAAWCGASGRGRLDAASLAALAARAAPLHEEVVRRLRAARVALKPMAASDPALASLRAAVKRLELDAERAEQAALEAALAARPAGAPAAAREADAAANMSAYLTYLGAPAAAAALAGGPLGRALAGGPGD